MRTLKLLTLALALALLAPVAVLAQAISGLVTVGTGSGASSGTVNLSDYPTVSTAVTAALNRGKTVFFLPGTYDMEAPVTISASDVTIMGTSASTLLVGGSSSVGLFSVTGSRFKMRDVAVKFDATVGDQIAIDVSGDDPTFDGVTFTNTATDGTTSTPMSYARFGTTSAGIAAPAIRGCRVHSAKGMILFQVNGDSSDSAKLGQGAMFVGNHFGLETTSTPEAMYKGILFSGAGESVFTGNRVHGLGSGSDSAHAFIHATTPNSESEAHHLTITGNSFELVTADHLIRGDGFRFITFTGNQVGRCAGNGASEGTFHITDNTGTGTDGGAFVFQGNEIHNASSATGRIFWIEDTDTGIVSNNMFSLINGTLGTLNTTALNLTWGPNRYRMSQGVTDNILQMSSGAYTGLVIEEPSLPSGVNLTGTQPGSGATINGVKIGVTSPLEGQAGFRRTRTTGAANGADVTVTGFTTGDTLMRVINITDKTVEALSDYTPGAGIITQTTDETATDTLIVEWFDA